MLQAGKKRIAIGDQRQALDNARIGVLFHGMGKADNTVAAHHTIGIQHQHEGIGAAPAGHKILDIAGFAADIARTVPVINMHRALQSVPKRQKSALFGHPDIRIGGVRQHKHIKGVGLAQPVDFFDHGLQRGKNPRGGLVVNRHDQSGALAQRGNGTGCGLFFDQRKEPKNGRTKGQGNPRKIDAE